MAIRENVGMYDMSSFGKIRVEGPDAEAFLNYMWAGVTTQRAQWARSSTPSSSTPAGGIEADVTVTRLTETSYLVVTPAATRLADQTWMDAPQRRDFNVVITDVTAGEGVLAVMGPNARASCCRWSPPTTSPTR